LKTPHEFRAYVRDPDGHLIEVGQSKEVFVGGMK
jgi:hypothetical protein